MTFTASITDDDIEDYLADRLDQARRERVEAWLREHPDREAEVRAMREHQDVLRAVGADILNEPIPARLLALLDDDADLDAIDIPDRNDDLDDVATYDSGTLKSY
jgi:anti-sigma factor RsiW